MPELHDQPLAAAEARRRTALLQAQDGIHCASKLIREVLSPAPEVKLPHSSNGSLHEKLMERQRKAEQGIVAQRKAHEGAVQQLQADASGLSADLTHLKRAGANFSDAEVNAAKRAREMANPTVRLQPASPALVAVSGVAVREPSSNQLLAL